jgi:hypothetical protein
MKGFRSENSSRSTRTGFISRSAEAVAWLESALTTGETTLS